MLPELRTGLFGKSKVSTVSSPCCQIRRVLIFSVRLNEIFATCIENASCDVLTGTVTYSVCLVSSLCSTEASKSNRQVSSITPSNYACI